MQIVLESIPSAAITGSVEGDFSPVENVIAACQELASALSSGPVSSLDVCRVSILPDSQRDKPVPWRQHDIEAASRLAQFPESLEEARITLRRFL